MKTLLLRAGILLCAVFAFSGCAGTGLTVQSPVTTNPAAVTTSDVTSYVTPWLQAAANVANALAGTNLIAGGAVAAAETIANAALSAFSASPSPSTLNTLNNAMVPVYQQVNKSAPAVTTGKSS